MSRTKLLSLLTTGLTVGLLASACVAEDDVTRPEDACEGGKCDAAGDESEAGDSLCVALRGNGERIFATLTGMARVVEHYGLLSGAAGGSSGSIATFIAESVHLHPAVYECGDQACSPAESALRASLLLKSTLGYFQVLATTDEAAALQNLAPLAARLQAEGQNLASEDLASARASLETLLRSPELRDLLNHELLETLLASPDPSFHVAEIIDTLQSFGSFSTDDPAILIRPGLVDFAGAAQKVGRVGSFYAGYAPADADGMARFLDTCAAQSLNLDFREIAALPTDLGVTCGELFAHLVMEYRDALQGREAEFRSRIDDAVGTQFHSLVATSLLTGDASDTWREARNDYLQARPWSFDIDFEDVRFGYFSSEDDRARIDSNPLGFRDAKTARTVGLGTVTWQDALVFSPAEPGLDRAIALEGVVQGEFASAISAGGWPDLHPVLALKNVGCDRVVYVTRTGRDSKFGTGMATLLQASPEEVDELYSVDLPESGFSTSIAQADATLCTNWDSISGLDLPQLTGDAYFAELETDDPFFSDGVNGAGNVIPRAEGRLGCSPQ